MPYSLIGYGLALIILLFPLGVYLLNLWIQEKRTRNAVEKGTMFSEGPRAQHPHIDHSICIGCGSCVRICPEGDVLALIGGKASIINGHKCIGHGLCAESCPVDAIEMRMAAPSQSSDRPYLTPEHETNIENLFIAGELGGLALIKNAINHGRECADTITARIAKRPSEDSQKDRYDVCIVGAGPAGISASLRAIQNGLHYLTLEQSDIGGTVARYPRQKLVMTSPVEFPLYGTFRKLTLSKEEILAFWNKVGNRADFVVHTQEKMEDVRKDPDGGFSVFTSKGRYRATAVILALGQNGTPRKLGVKGEDVPKVMYRLIEAEAYMNSDIVVVGGGDSAIEAAMGLALQKGNRVVLSYRGDSFRRIKERNAQRIEEFRSSGKLQVLLNSNLIEIGKKNVVLECGGSRREIPNDFVWIFAGGVPPKDFLQKIGVQFGTQKTDTIY